MTPHPQKVMIEVTSKFHCGTCDNHDCDWWKERDQISRINTMINREYVNHFSMRLATEMSGCRCHRSAKSEQEIREKVLDEAIAAIENQKDHKEFLLSRSQKDIVEDILDGIRCKQGDQP